MRGGALVEHDELVRLGTAETAPAAQEVVEAVPFRPVGHDEDVEVHGRLLLQALVRARRWGGAYNDSYFRS
ncbi:hypothetical protein SSP531S_50530 [Streptomyces spongiicola]|uniref:Uncharacterized protein n=1 Tax=Streptomyces spongiicola TaxID=1690221 RepID=A0A388T3Q8_9ACTN|nr:hypothetical protein SSP531S_50530 [Streptomyces spongiicola]